MTAFRYSLAKDRRVLTISVVDYPLAMVRLSAGDLETVLGQLSAIRSRMEPEVPKTWVRRETYKGTRAPSLAVEPDPTGDSLLHLRHPGLGWLHFLLPKAVARGLGEMLLKHADEALPSQVVH